MRRWAGRYAPLVATDGIDGLMADVSGVPDLFGGEEDLRQDLQARLERVGLHAASAIPGTLNHLPRETFVAEAKLAADPEGQSPGILRKIAESIGLADDFAKWESSHAA